MSEESSIEELQKEVWLTSDEAMRYFKISKNTMKKYLREGKLIGQKCGGWRIHRQLSDAMLTGVTNYISVAKNIGFMK